MKGQRTISRSGAFTLTELSVIVACVALLTIILLPALARARQKSQRAGCQCRLKQIGLAFRTWEGDHSDKYPMLILTNSSGAREPLTAANIFRCYQVMSNELNNPKILTCPSDDRRPAVDFAHLSNSNLSYFTGADADETFPAMLLSGDRNLVTNGVPVVPGILAIDAGVTVGWAATLHLSAGNIGLSDGSVQQVSSAGLQQLFARSWTNVNRLAIP